MMDNPESQHTEERAMGGLCVEVVSKETIKPSSPTPSHLNTVELSLIDQLAVRHFGPILLFFSSSAVPNSVRVDCLKKSLSKALNLFYPFAGRIIDNRFIHCNDDGISFFEARVNAQMARIVSHPIREELVQLIPHDANLSPVPEELLMVQINIFDCGGMALCLCVSHGVADASSQGFFLNTWAATARGDPADKIPCPVFTASHFFPPIETELLPPVSDPVGTQPEIVSKRFIFTAPNISTLRDKCYDKLLYRPSRVETVSAFLWRCVMNVAGWRSSTLFQVMNLRTRMDPPLANSLVGNFVSGATVTSSATPTPPELECLVGELHRATSKVDGDYVRKLQENNGILKTYETNQPIFGITSWCRFPFYEADFGWGKPEWMTTVQMICADLIFLIDTKCGTGIEAWVSLDKQVMARFECEPNLIAFTQSRFQEFSWRGSRL